MTGLQPAIWPTTTNSRMSGQSGKFGDALWTVLQQLFGLLFALTLAWGILAFPIYKNMSTGYVPVAVGLLLVLMIYGRRASTWIGEVLARPNVRSFVIFVVAVGVAVRMAAVLSLRAQPLSDHACYNELALKLYHGQQLGPTAYFPPGMVFWLLLIYSIFGESLLAVQLVNALVGGLFVWLTYDVGRRVVGDRAARLAALISAVFPSLVLYTTTLGYGPLLGCVLLSAISLFLRRGPPSGHPWWYVAVIGVILGLACLVKPIGLVLPLVIGLCYWRRQTPVLRAARNTAILVVSLSVVISPWAIRNYLSVWQIRTGNHQRRCCDMDNQPSERLSAERGAAAVSARHYRGRTKPRFAEGSAGVYSKRPYPHLSPVARQGCIHVGNVHINHGLYFRRPYEPACGSGRKVVHQHSLDVRLRILHHRDIARRPMPLSSSILATRLPVSLSVGYPSVL